MPVTIDNLLKPYQLAKAVELYSTGDTIGSVHDDYLDSVKAEKPFPCPKCGGTGVHELSKDTGNLADTEIIECTMQDVTGTIKCEGWGYVEQEIQVAQTSPIYIIKE